MIDVVIVLTLLALGYGFGTYREKKHFKSIQQREAEHQNIMVFESRFPPEEDKHAGAQLVQGNVVVSADYFKRFVAGLRMLVGGRLRSYETLLERGRREAVLRMKEAAKEQGADKIFNVKFETSSVSKGEGNALGSIEVLVYGSALKSQ